MKGKIAHYIKGSLGLLLLCGMLLTLLPFQLLHDHGALHKTVTHSVKDEADPCHVSIYHPERKEAISCKHEKHVSEGFACCSLCKVVVPHLKKDDLSPSSIQVEVSRPISRTLIPAEALPVVDAGYFQGRAPPLSV